MDHLLDPSALDPEAIERIERQSMRVLYQAAFDFGFDAFRIFEESSDDEKDIAEDITREMLDRLGGYAIAQRVFGNVDYRKARYVILPEISVRQALFIDSKAEKDQRSATLQLSQTSMTVIQARSGSLHQEVGKLPTVVTYGPTSFLVTTLFAHYAYEKEGGKNRLKRQTLACVPSGSLQEKYNPDCQHSIWLAGRNAPSLGEEFRFRLSFAKLERIAAWRVQRIDYDLDTEQILSTWQE